MDYRHALGQTDDTIVAVATAVGQGALAVLRVSGPRSWEIVNACFCAAGRTPWLQRSPRTAVFGTFAAPDGSLLDEVLAIGFLAPASFTGEDSAELSFHGSPYIARTALSSLIAAGARLAEPGEFTRRAFLNGKMDLSQAEAVADLIASESAAGHAVAFRQLKGSVSRRMDELRTELIDTTALLELELDFSEEDVEFASRDRLMALLTDLQTEVAQLLETFVLGQALKEGVPTALLGAPNAGKSTLLNALLREERALVSAVPGTTRDTVEERFTAGGILFRLVDTAGIRETDETVERLGIERSQEAARRAAVQVLVVDAAVWNADPQPTLDLWAQLEDWNPQSHRVLVFNKADQEQPISPPEGALVLSAATGAGVSELEAALAQWVTQNPAYGADTVVSHARHAAALRAAADSLSQAENALRTGLSGELVAIDLRDALRHIGSITGQVVADDLLSSIFSRFCIGK